ncbi:MAG TPA: mycofactocin precursor MftA [Ilumatobacteraceae bacterium]|nr:mycofactocin precursor MftA [Ilumatobacteraceae bacterium]
MDESTNETDSALTVEPLDAEIVEELLVEEISIDGMCGVY